MTDAEADARFACYLELYEKNWVLFPDVRPCLESLRGKPLGVITNGTVPQQMKKLRRLELADRFEPVVISEGVGSSKPEPRIFLEACRLAGARPQDCVYVGDRLDTDARAAAAVGMRGVWLNHNRREVDGPAGVETVTTLADLPALLEKIS